MAENLFPRSIWITLYAVESGPDGLPVLKNPLQGTDYKISPFTLEDIDAVDAWIRQRSLDKFVETTKSIDGITETQFCSMVAEEVRRVNGISWGSTDGLKLLSSIDGLSFLLWQVIHKGTDLAFAQLREMFFVKKNQEQALETIRRLNCLDTWGVSHPTEARSQGQEQTVTQTTTKTKEPEKKTLSQLLQSIM